MTVRVYLPAVLADVATLVRTGSLLPRTWGYAVTAAVRAADPDGDEDEWEFLAFAAAADASLALLSEGQAPPRRVVVSVDLPAELVQEQPDADAGLVGVATSVPRTAVAAVHVDGVQAVEQVAHVLQGAEPVGLDDIALEWFDVSELDHLA